MQHISISSFLHVFTIFRRASIFKEKGRITFFFFYLKVIQLKIRSSKANDDRENLYSNGKITFSFILWFTTLVMAFTKPVGITRTESMYRKRGCLVPVTPHPSTPGLVGQDVGGRTRSATHAYLLQNSIAGVEIFTDVQ